MNYAKFKTSPLFRTAARCISSKGSTGRAGRLGPRTRAMESSSFYDLPPMLRWFSGNIGYHHVHHLGPRIPNYRLKECFDVIPALKSRQPLTLRGSLACIRLKLWDEERQELVAF